MNQENNQEMQNQPLTNEQSTVDDKQATTVNCPPLECRIVPKEFDPAIKRVNEALKLRIQRAIVMAAQPLPEDKIKPDNPADKCDTATGELCNGDEKRFQNENFFASYSKGLKHNNYGEPDKNAYCAYLNALKEGTFEAIEKLHPNYLGCYPTPAKCKTPADTADAEARVQIAPAVVAAGDQLPLVNPLAALAFELQGIDSHQALVWEWGKFESSGRVKQTAFPSAPKFDSAEEIAEIAENYWMALMRDVPFSKYKDGGIAQDAANDLKLYDCNKAPTTKAHLFRDNIIPGVNDGPYVSQFLLRPVPFASWTIDPRMRTVLPVTESDGTINLSRGGRDYLTDFDRWLCSQKGCKPQPPRDLFDNVPRFIRNGRDLGQYVHTDFLYEQYLSTALILSTPSDIDPPPPDPKPSTPANEGLAQPPCNDTGAFPGNLIFGGGVFVNDLLDDLNPYKNAKAQIGFGTLGVPNLFALIAEAAIRAMRAVWYQKWSVHRRLRPEEFAGRIQVHLDPNKQHGNKKPSYPFDAGNLKKLQNNGLLGRILKHNDVLNGGSGNGKKGTYLLPQAFPEGCPLHPSYGAGHATVAGACVTILKAWFEDKPLSEFVANESPRPDKRIFVPIEANEDGTKLREYSGGDANKLTIHGELNKLAANISLGRNFAGVHWRSDHLQSLRLGEAIAIWLLCDIRKTYRERFGFSLTTFSGQRIFIDKNNDDCFKAKQADQKIAVGEEIK